MACVQRRRDQTTWQMVTADMQVEAGKTYWIEISATGNTANDGGYTILMVR
jgi:hypothetical protein